MHRNVFGGVLAGALIGGWLVAAVMASNRSPNWEIWVGDSGLISASIGAVTAGLLVWGSVVAVSTFRLSQRTHLAERFGEAASLISADRATARLTGLTLLGDIVREDSSRYAAAALRSISACIAECDADIHLMVQRWHTNAEVDVDISRPSDITAAGALSELLKAFPSGNWPHASAIVYNGKLHLGNAFISQVTIADEIIRNLVIPRALFDQITFRNCKIINCRFVGYIRSQVSFVDCDLTDSEFDFAMFSQYLQPWQTHVLRFESCTGLDSARINGQGLADWVASRDRPENGD